MSKRNKSVEGIKNTLYNYFALPPVKKINVDTSLTPDSTTSSEKKEILVQSKKRQINTVSSTSMGNGDDDEIIAPKRKRIRVISDDSSDTENEAENKMETDKEVTPVGKKLNDSFKFEPGQFTKSPKPKTPVARKDQNTTSNGTPAKSQDNPEPSSAAAGDGNWSYCKLDWLRPDKIRDIHNRRPDHPDYDPGTLLVPAGFLKSQTPAHRQWWEMKSTHYDCVLFFKVGKFYELYHMDAAIGVNELGFSYMKGELAHCGFPESAYGRMASTLVSKGYKVARVEQTETPKMMQERFTKSPKVNQDKVVRREICQVTVRGTQVCSLQDPGPADATANYMIAVAEEETLGCSTYGVCFLDASIGQFHIGQFKDDKHSSRLLTTLAHYPPALIVYDRKSTTVRTSKLLSTHCHSARRESHNMWSPERTLKTLAEKHYRTDAEGDWPEGLKPFLHEGDALGLTPAANCYLAVKALGGCVSYLTDCLLDIQILGMSQFSHYSPPDVLNQTLSQEQKAENKWQGRSTMVLDAITLRNLRVVQDEGCLYEKLNFCSTPMGKRLLYQWVCAPSCSLTVIKERQEAVKVMFENQELCQDVKNILTTLPDMERLLAKVHALGNSLRSKQHPDSRAIFYEDKIYSKRKVHDFLAVLKGFAAVLNLVELFSDVDSALLAKTTQYAPNGKFPNYETTLKFFKDGMDQSQAEKEGRIVPGAGVDEDYDASLQRIEEIEHELKQYLSELEKKFRCRLTYVGTQKKRYQIEVPESAAAKAGSEFHMESARKGFKRFSTSTTKDLLERMIEAEEQKSNALNGLSRRMFEKFSAHYNQWEAVVQCVATLDILLAFAEFARQQTCDICLPDVTFDKDTKPYIEIVEGRHPCISLVNEFIPNDTSLGSDKSLLLLTGPNMGGKSTLMRQVGLLTLLAHLGSYVPAQECKLSLVDRIFTRLGASDDILSGQSTFLVEMNETAAIVKHATVHSLVLLDELGRGTSTYDGTAIASGVCVELADRGCRAVFSTHYHSLVRHLAYHPHVLLGHMACMVETEEPAADSEDQITEEVITFLYKLTPGACPKSYGFNAARLAGIPREITRRAQQVSKQLETEATVVRTFRDLIATDDPKVIRRLLQELNI